MKATKNEYRVVENAPLCHPEVVQSMFYKLSLDNLERISANIKQCSREVLYYNKGILMSHDSLFSIILLKT